MTIDAEMERLITEHARRRGYQEPTKYLRDLLKEDEGNLPESSSRGQRLVEHLRGKATRGLTTDQILVLAREWMWGNAKIIRLVCAIGRDAR